MSFLGYVRISLDENGERGVGLAAQRSAIRAEVDRRGWELLEVYEDAGFSGKDFNRPAIREVMDVLRRKQADALVVSKLDRLSRSLLDFATVMEKARKEQWGVVALDLAVDTTTPSGEVMAHVMASFAHYERRLIAQRTSEALEELRSKGKAYGPVPYGYRREGDLLICPRSTRRHHRASASYFLPLWIQTWLFAGHFWMEPTGIEPATSCLQSRRSPS